MGSQKESDFKLPISIWWLKSNTSGRIDWFKSCTWLDWKRQQAGWLVLKFSTKKTIPPTVYLHSQYWLQNKHPNLQIPSSLLLIRSHISVWLTKIFLMMSILTTFTQIGLYWQEGVGWLSRLACLEILQKTIPHTVYLPTQYWLQNTFTQFGLYGQEGQEGVGGRCRKCSFSEKVTALLCSALSHTFVGRAPTLAVGYLIYPIIFCVLPFYLLFCVLLFSSSVPPEVP